MRIDLLGVLLLQTEQHLNWLSSVNELHRIILQLEMGLGGVLVDMGCDIVAVDLLFGNAFLVHTHTGQESFGSGVDLSATITDDTDNDLLPGFLSPCLASTRAVAHVLDVLEDTHHGAGKEDIVLIVHGDDNEQLSVSRLTKEPLSQGEIAIVEIVGVTCSCGISHVGKLISFAVVVVLQQHRWHGTIEHEVSSVEFNLLDSLVALNSTSTSWDRLVLVWLTRCLRVLMRQHGPMSIVLVPLIVAILRGGFVRLVVVGIVVRFRVD